MGRYDRIEVFDGYSYRKPQEIQVWDGYRYVSLGNDQSYNTQHIYAHTGGGSYPRVTLQREDYVIPGEVYSYGTLKLMPKSNAGWNPHSNTAPAHLFECDIMKTTNGAVNILNSNNGARWKCALIITWNENGTISFYTRSMYHRSGNNPVTITTSNAVGANQWAHLKISAPKGVNSSAWQVTIEFNGVVTKGTTYNTWTVANADNVMGDPNLRWRGTANIMLGRYQGSDDTSRPAQWVLNMSSNPVYASVGSIQQSMTVTNTSTTGTRWI